MRYLVSLFVLIALAWSLHTKAGDNQEKTYGDLASRLCKLYSISGGIVEDSKDAIFIFIKSVEEGYPTPSNKEVIKLLNANKHSMICENGKNFINFAIEKGYYNEIIVALFGEELYTDEVLLDFNAITVVYNPETKTKEPMTVLDYIGKVALKDPAISGSEGSKREIKEIRELLIEEFGAKPFSELSAAQLSEWKAYKAQR